ncbi:MAG: T9SS type A sorting domain-containing protein [Cyclobacteriaceae bacterium]
MRSIVTLSLALFTLTSFSQDYYWVGGSGDWSDFSTHWATSSGGSTFHTSAPSSTNDVYFDVNSFSVTNQVVTLDDFNADCNSMDWTGSINFPSIDGNGNTLNIYGSLTLSPDMTSDLRFVEFESISTGNTVTTNGTSVGSSAIVRFRGVGGEWTLQDNIVATTIDVIGGTFNSGNNNIDVSDFFTSTGSNVRTINLGSSLVASERVWIRGTNQTINAGTSKILTSSFYTDVDGDGPFTFHDVEFTNYGRLRHSASFNEITVPAGLELKLRSGDVFTINNLVADGTKHNPIVVSSDTDGSEAIVSKSSGSISVSHVELKDVHATGTAVFIANESADKGNNSGWTINAPTSLNFYWVGDTGNWFDYSAHWATSSGGSTMHTDYPGRNDNVFFDANSFTITGQEVTVDLDAHFYNMDWTGALNSPKLRSSSVTLYPHGSVTFISGMTKNVNSLNFEGDDTGLTFSALGSGYNSNISFWGDGTYDLLSDIETNSFNHYSGTINYNDIVINCTTHNIGTSPHTATANLESATVICTNLVVESSPSPTVNMGTSSFEIAGDLDGFGVALYDVIMNGSGEITGSNTFEFLSIDAGSSISFEEGETQTVNQTLSIDGTKAKPISLNSAVSSTQAMVSMNSATVNASYLILQDIAAIGTATFNATQTIDNGNNTGWNITGIVGESYYWVGNGGDWSDFSAHWATTSGGVTFHTTVPGVLDNVIFDGNSFNVSSEVVNIDDTQVNLTDLDASLVSQPFIISGSGKQMNIYGSVDIPALVTTQISTINFLTTSSETINFNNGPGEDYDLNFSSAGTWTLNSSVTADKLTLENGTFNTNDNEVNLSTLAMKGSSVKVLNLGLSAVHVAFMTVDPFAENVTVNGGSSDLFVSRNLSLEEYKSTIALNNLTFLNVELPHFESKISDDLTLNNLTIGAGKELRPVGHRTVVVSTFYAVGTESEPIIITATDESSSFTISQSSGTVDGEYLQMDNVTATGGATFNAFNSLDNGGVVGWIFHRSSQTITFDALATKIYEDEPFSLSAIASSGLEVEFSVVSGPVSISGNTLSIIGVGTAEIKAEQAGNIDFDPAPSVTRSLEILRADQMISFADIPSKTYGDPTFDLGASGGNSDNPVVYISSDENVATISGAEVAIIGAGTSIITASQVGSDLYNPALDVDKILTVNKADQTISFDTIDDYDLDTEADPIELIASSSGGLTITFQVDGPASLSGSILTPSDVGSITVTATQPGDDNYNPAISVEREFSVVSSALGLTAEEIGISLYPNPTQRFLYLQSRSKENFEVEICSMNGQMILHKKITKNVTQVDLSTLSVGTYLVVLKENERIIGTSRLIMK